MRPSWVRFRQKTDINFPSFFGLCVAGTMWQAHWRRYCRHHDRNWEGMHPLELDRMKCPKHMRLHRRRLRQICVRISNFVLQSGCLPFRLYAPSASLPWTRFRYVNEFVDNPTVPKSCVICRKLLLEKNHTMWIISVLLFRAAFARIWWAIKQWLFLDSSSFGSNSNSSRFILYPFDWLWLKETTGRCRSCMHGRESHCWEYVDVSRIKTTWSRKGLLLCWFLRLGISCSDDGRCAAVSCM